MSYFMLYLLFFFFFKQKTAYEMRISDWSSDVCSSDLLGVGAAEVLGGLLKDCFDNALEVGHHFAIPETDHPPAERLQIIGPPRVIGRGFEMLAVEFNAKPRLAAGEVDDIGADHQLAGEARAVAGQFAPKQAFCFRPAVSEGGCVLDRKSAGEGRWGSGL